MHTTSDPLPKSNQLFPGLRTTLPKKKTLISFRDILYHNTDRQTLLAEVQKRLTYSDSQSTATH